MNGIYGVNRICSNSLLWFTNQVMFGSKYGGYFHGFIRSFFVCVCVCAVTRGEMCEYFDTIFFPNSWIFLDGNWMVQPFFVRVCIHQYTIDIQFECITAKKWIVFFCSFYLIFHPVDVDFHLLCVANHSYVEWQL